MTTLFFSPHGRINRGAYWAASLLIYVTISVTAVIDWRLGGLVALLSVWPSIVIGVKRWHDRDKSGWWMLLSLVPVVGSIWTLVELGFLAGTVGPNRFGSDPLVPVASGESETPFYRDLRIIRVLLQVGAVAVVAGLLWYLYNNLTTNLRAQGIRSDFGFLDQPFGVPIADSPLSPNASIRRALWAGLKNTFSLVIVGLPLLTIVGVSVGVARLSANWLTRKVATLYVELFRNLPPLLIIVFVFRVVILPLPRPTQSAEPFDLFVINNLRITVPSFMSGPGYSTFLWVLLGAAVVALAVGWWRTRRFVATGDPHHRVLWSLGTFVFFGALFYLILGGPIRISVPNLDGRVVTGGFSGLGAWFSVMIALMLYQASHVAEIVRGSIQAVPKGQTEAANALALSGFQRLRYVVLPQALRIAIPPTINQYLNYTKNTSLAIAVAFSEATLVAFQAIGNGAPAPQVVLMLMGAYLLFSLTISLLVNLINRRLQLVTN